MGDPSVKEAAGDVMPKVADDESKPAEVVAEPTGIWALLPSPAQLAMTFGIIGSLMVYGVLQEKIMTKPYGVDSEGNGGEMFKNSFFLVLNNRFAAGFVAAMILIAQKEYSQLKNTAPLYKYFMVSVSNVVATTCQYEALKHVTFPTQTLFKCGKMVPVMIWGTFISAKKYTIVDYAVAVCVALGCTAFTLTGNIVAKKGAANSSLYGMALMAGYLGFDGFTSTFQEKLFASYEMTMYNQMLYVNGCSAVMSIVFSALSGQIMSTLAFLTKHPQVLYDALILSFSAVSGQFCISYTIKNFGALLYATIMTIRQLLSVIVSNLLFRHSLTPWQWVATIGVFGSLLFKSWFSKRFK
ncbi:Adenosine 3'-phospho 5'-phosphosulfate transporter 1 [Porphyridium purpureum]|uniref:Adenosine 3'-phospho 5'-phosphosulfate transporter 1 n=1 Tax=Porphyridium purpureum TaxID=35688 RepID=A0A5J4YXY6_PORPP|nr:Adenosine 3'-phospho 5'-phosphosulfate transporter 1 [Porphyridium purpureum]|eukprot:POR2481..scf209_3